VQDNVNAYNFILEGGGGGLPFFGNYFGDGPIKVAYCKTIK
jgi:hypothetical protein